MTLDFLSEAATKSLKLYGSLHLELHRLHYVQ